ncbi:RagB/SusD family nutrient uptake outer membrane protein [Sunxiuqinia sp. A32]|uniref:RagB/SusD family nutrient uptake outer membrane protein n=1 Tax=Sunxiuqinia sp. A32 TaxID=3461496 RepID=UPI00404522AA
MKYTLIILLGLIVLLSSCEKFLEETPTGSLTDESQITSAAGADALAVGAYRALPSWTNGAVWWGGNLAGALEYATGKAYSQYQGAELWKFEQNSESGESEYFIHPWNNWYQGVRDCNLAIKMIPGVTELSDVEKDKLLGEVRTMRAFYYFCLVRHYGDVVMNTDILTDVTLAQQPRTSLVKIYDDIIVPDLEFAVNQTELPDEQSSIGRVTKHVARAILADVYLTMSGYPYQEAATDTTKNWCTEGLWSMTEYPVNTSSAKALLEKAKTQLDFLYGKYELGDFADIRNPEMDNKGGAIFQVQYTAGTRNNGMISTTLPLASQISQFGDENGTVIPSVEYYNSYNAADKRIGERVYFFSSDNKSTKYDSNEGPAAKFPVNFLYKYYDTKAIKETGESGLNFNLYRYADILLMRTEVYWALGQHNQNEVAGINEVRERAGLSTFLPGDLTLKDILAERAYELVFENKMLFDMRRTRTALIDGGGEFAGVESFVGHQPSHFNFEFSAKHLLAPVSSTEIDNNRECLQNYGWNPQQVGQ